MPRQALGINVKAAALGRILPLYEDGHRVVVSFSAGKDSGACLELCIEAARLTDRLPVDVVLRDEEAMFPGTYEYAERVFARPEIAGHWLCAGNPNLNVYNRAQPYWWVLDQQLHPDEWVRQPPAYAYRIPEHNIDSMTTPARFPAAPGKSIYSIVGLRVAESHARLFGLYSSGGYITKPQAHTGVRLARPIYDWSDGDVWKAHSEHGWDYNTAYDTLHRAGFPARRLRIAPPTQSVAGADHLRAAQAAWPAWFDRVCARLPGVREGARYGKRVVQPHRRAGESWQACYQRECLGPAVPDWIKERAEVVMRAILQAHRRHSTQPLPEVARCPQCGGSLTSWRNLALAMWGGDPMAHRAPWILKAIEPDFFRPGAGLWGGRNSW